ncbi:MAG TPA: TerB family tellurite resistance protein [Bacteroidales bacterium]|nr:TerB family tellurite resistance protein [Bacteroidales bacterium]HPS45536.1 TerB family tellurite resistance protein [Bacteroidales bacterium]HQH19233.1 TerB family tellurite resistance protein [Bacteroidales bacterium]HQI46357.1 TerB family tellurite resistance protein [Bacteroidales bacterium]
MGKYGKWLGGGLGWALGGPIGGIIGFIVGSMYDSFSEYTVDTNFHQPRETLKGDFSVTLLVLSASVMKADGKALKSELDYIKTFFLRQISPEETHQRLLMLKEILKQNYSLYDVCLQVKQNMEHSLRLQLLHYLFGIAMADGQVSVNELNIIQQISSYLGINSKDFESIKAMFIKDSTSSYTILETSPDATDEEIKKAYRKMAVKYHPDKVSQMGEDVQKAAKEKFQKLNAAYETIKKQRGIN